MSIESNGSKRKLRNFQYEEVMKFFLLMYKWVNEKQETNSGCSEN